MAANVTHGGPKGWSEAGARLPPIEASAGEAVVPDASLLFTAEYSRVGDHLLLTGADGATQLITGYFALEAPPLLFSPEGAMMPPHVVAALVGPRAPGLAQAGPLEGAQPIGQVESVVGTAQAIREGVPVGLNPGDPVFQNDVVQTGLGSQLIIGFADATIFSLSANSRMTLDGLVYDPQGAGNSLATTIFHGGLSFITGQVAPTGEMLVETPVATIGVRGTVGLCTLESIAGPLSCAACEAAGGTLADVFYQNPLTGATLAGLTNCASVYGISGPGAPVVERPQTPQEQAAFAQQAAMLNAVQGGFVFLYGTEPIFLPQEGRRAEAPPVEGPAGLQGGGIGIEAEFEDVMAAQRDALDGEFRSAALFGAPMGGTGTPAPLPPQPDGPEPFTFAELERFVAGPEAPAPVNNPPVDFDVNVTAQFSEDPPFTLADGQANGDNGDEMDLGSGGVSAGGAIFITGHDSDEHGNGAYMSAGLDFLLFGSTATPALRGEKSIAFISVDLGTNPAFVISQLEAFGYTDVTVFPIDQGISGVFSGAFDAIMVGSGGGASDQQILVDASDEFAAYLNGGGALYINTDEGFGQTWYDFVPQFGTTTNNTISALGAFTPTSAGLDIGLTEPVVDADITHSFYTGVDTDFFTVFEVTDPAFFPENPNLPVAFGARNIGVEEGEFVRTDLGPGFFFEFQVGEAEMVVDNIHGTDVEDGVTTQFTITSLPTDAEGNQVGQLLIDRGDDGVIAIEDIFGDEASPLPEGGIEVESGDSVVYFLPEDDAPPPESVSFTYFTIDSGGLTSLNDGPAVVTIDIPA